MTRKVRTPAGEARYDGPIGSIIRSKRRETLSKLTERRAKRLSTLSQLSDELSGIDPELAAMRQERKEFLARIAKNNAEWAKQREHVKAQEALDRKEEERLKAEKEEDVGSLPVGKSLQDLPHWLWGGGAAAQRELNEAHQQLNMRRLV